MDKSGIPFALMPAGTTRWYFAVIKEKTKRNRIAEIAKYCGNTRKPWAKPVSKSQIAPANFSKNSPTNKND